MNKEVTDHTESELNEILLTSFDLIQKHKSLIENFILDFFSENLWNNLSEEWQEYIDEASLNDFMNLLDFSNTSLTNVPTSLLNIRTRIIQLSLPRTLSIPKDINQSSETQFPLLLDKQYNVQRLFIKKCFRKVKKKKQHEILSFSKITSQCALKTKVDFIIDIGAGLGHLSRILTYVYEQKVIAIDANPAYKNEAIALDNNLEIIMLKEFPGPYKLPESPTHLTHHLAPQTDTNEFLKMLEVVVKSKTFTFGLIGLHPCGDLAVTLLRMYKNCVHCKFINLASCCYMKLTSKDECAENYGFPLSTPSIENQISLTYNLRELACHAIENYVEKLHMQNMEHLKVHVYRAVLEKLIVDKYPDQKHRQIRSVKYKDGLPFKKYCNMALMGSLNLEFDDGHVEKLLSQWKRVVGYYCLRTIFAPLIETVILIDRHMFVKECGFSNVKAYFDAKISPRVHLLTAVKGPM